MAYARKGKVTKKGKKEVNNLIVRKSVLDVEKELSEINKKLQKMEKELEHVEMLERMLAQHEIVLAKKISDINRFDDELRKVVRKEELDEVKESLKKLDEHETILAENNRFMREVINEVGKIKESHKMTKQHVFGRKHITREDFDEKFSSIKETLDELEHMKTVHKKKVGRDELEYIRNELHERMSQLEYQNKLLMSYLKKVDELLQNKI